MDCFGSGSSQLSSAPSSKTPSIFLCHIWIGAIMWGQAENLWEGWWPEADCCYFSPAFLP